MKVRPLGTNSLFCSRGERNGGKEGRRIGLEGYRAAPFAEDVVATAPFERVVLCRLSPSQERKAGSDPQLSR